MNFLVDKEGYYGEFGGAYVPEILHKCVEELQNTYLMSAPHESYCYDDFPMHRLLLFYKAQ